MQYLAFVRLDVAADHLKKGRLTCSVVADQGDLVAPLDRKRDVIKQQPGMVRLRYFVYRYQRHG